MGVFELEGKELMELEGPLKTKKKLKVGGKEQEFEFNVLTVEDEKEVIEYALQEESAYNARYEKAFVTKTLGKKVTEENVQWACNLDLFIYYLALFYPHCMYHGVSTTVSAKCTCGKTHTVIVPIMSSLLSVTTGMIMARYNELAKGMDFKSFVDLTIPEYSALVQSMK